MIRGLCFAAVILAASAVPLTFQDGRTLSIEVGEEPYLEGYAFLSGLFHTTQGCATPYYNNTDVRLDMMLDLCEPNFSCGMVETTKESARENLLCGSGDTSYVYVKKDSKFEFVKHGLRGFDWYKTRSVGYDEYGGDKPILEMKDVKASDCAAKCSALPDCEYFEKYVTSDSCSLYKFDELCSGCTPTYFKFWSN